MSTHDESPEKNTTGSKAERKPSKTLDDLIREQGIEEPTDLDAILGCLKGAIDDEFLEAIRQQREPR